MQSLRDQLLKAGLVTQDQVSKVETTEANKAKRKRRKKPTAKVAAPRKPATDSAPVPVRTVDLTEPNRLRIYQAIERHRVRGETRGEMEFYFKLRDNRVRKMYVSKEISGGLQSGRLAIVENGEPDKHIIVGCDAVAPIAEIDPGMVRFFNQLT